MCLNLNSRINICKTPEVFRLSWVDSHRAFSEVITIISRSWLLPSISLISKAKAIVKLRACIAFKTHCSNLHAFKGHCRKSQRVHRIPLLPLLNFASPSLNALPNCIYLPQGCPCVIGRRWPCAAGPGTSWHWWCRATYLRLWRA